MVPADSKLFASIHKKLKIYERKQVSSPEMPSFFKRVYPQLASQFEEGKKSLPVFDIEKAADSLALAQYHHRGFVIDEKLNILHFRGDVGRFLEPKSGQASLTLTKILREELWLPLRGMIEAAKTKQAHQEKEFPLLWTGS